MRLRRCAGRSAPLLFAYAIGRFSHDYFISEKIHRDAVLKNPAQIDLLLQTLKVGLFESPHDKTNKMACVPSKDSDQPGHPPSLIRVFAVRMSLLGSLATHGVCSEDSDQTG